MREDASRRRFLKHSSGGYCISNWKLLPFSTSPARPSVIFFLAVGLLVGVFLSSRLLVSMAPAGDLAIKSTRETRKSNIFRREPQRHVDLSLNCATFNSTSTCPRSNYPTTTDGTIEEAPGRPSPPTCPDYFRWIHEDLRPWAHKRITKGMLEAAQKKAHFRLVIVKGKAYVETYDKAYQSRDILTLWGVLQLLRRYPGKVPDLELMFNCDDRPEIYRRDHSGPNSPAPPPLFRYSGDAATLDIVTPDWSFWGWPEINIKPWEAMLKDIKEGNKRMKWMEREPFAYWKGNPTVANTRRDLLKCNVSHKQDWNARLYRQDWRKESQRGFKDSNLANQCVHRFKIYIEGKAWSVSEKYILGCDSVTLIVRPHYYDFFTRSLIPMQHYWPISHKRKCSSIKFSVHWGNTHKQKAQAIGKAASKFIQEELKMEYVYDYMFHLLNEYSKLLTFKPTIPANATELCSESMACAAQGLLNKSMMESLVKRPADSSPCAMQPPYDPPSLDSLLRSKENSIKQVEKWERSFWYTQNKQQLQQ